MLRKSLAQIIAQPHIRCRLTLLMAHPCRRFWKPHVFTSQIERRPESHASIEQEHEQHGQLMIEAVGSLDDAESVRRREPIGDGAPLPALRALQLNLNTSMPKDC